MTIDINAIDNVPVVEETQDLPPRFYYLKGQKAAKTSGKFYGKESEFVVPPEEPWTPSQQFDDEDGYETPTLNIAILGHRSQPFIVDPQTSRKVWLSRYEQGATFYTELLCYAQGIGPAIWTMKGMVGSAVVGRNGLIKQFEKTVRKELQKRYNRQFNPWALWIPVGPAVDEKGNLYYQDTGYKSYFNLPSLRIPATPTEQLLDQLWVGTDLYREGAELYNQFRNWFKERRANDSFIADEAESETNKAPELSPYAGMPEVDIPADLASGF